MDDDASKSSEDSLEAGPTLDGQKFASIQELLDNTSVRELSQAYQEGGEQEVQNKRDLLKRTRPELDIFISEY